MIIHRRQPKHEALPSPCRPAGCWHKDIWCKRRRRDVGRVKPILLKSALDLVCQDEPINNVTKDRPTVVGSLEQGSTGSPIDRLQIQVGRSCSLLCRSQWHGKWRTQKMAIVLFTPMIQPHADFHTQFASPHLPSTASFPVAIGHLNYIVKSQILLEEFFCWLRSDDLAQNSIDFLRHLVTVHTLDTPNNFFHSTVRENSEFNGFDVAFTVFENAHWT